MRLHLYLRAYMAGIVVPTLLLLISTTVFALFRFYFEVPSQFVLAMAAGASNRISDGDCSECILGVRNFRIDPSAVGELAKKFYEEGFSISALLVGGG